jgi:DNA polymerase III delta prime subunit
VSDIFISYKREEQPVARKLANALENEGWSVWWDPKLRAGERFNDVIEKALNEAKCVIVLWSKRSVESVYVKDEATHALKRRKLVPVTIQQVELPFRFEELHTPNLCGWDGSKDFSEFRRLVEDISTILRPSPTGSAVAEEQRSLQAEDHGRPTEKDTNRPQQEAEERRLKQEVAGWVVTRVQAPRVAPEKLRSDLLKEVKGEVTDRLRQSLHYAVLGKETKPQEVRRSWDVEVKVTTQQSVLLAPNTEIIEVFDEEAVAGKLLILGAPGAGKTTTLLQLAQELVKRAEIDTREPMPVLLNLSSWKDDSQTIASWLVDRMHVKYGIRKDISQRWLDEHSLLPLFDGLDELEPARQERCVQAINAFQKALRPEHLVVCCRLAEYQNCQTKLELNGAVHLQPLTDEQIHHYLSSGQSPELWNDIQAAPELLELARSPLLLSMMTLVYEKGPIDSKHRLAPTPEGRKYLFDMYIDRMLSRVSKDQQYARDKTLHWLGWLARGLRSHTQTEFLLETLQPSWLESLARLLTYRTCVFLFTALTFLSLTYLTGWMMDFLPQGQLLIMVKAWLEWLANRSEPAVGSWLKNSGGWSTTSLAIDFIIAVAAGLAIGLKPTIKPIETLRWSGAKAWRGMILGLRRGSIGGVKYGTYIGVIAGLIMGAIWTLGNTNTGRSSGIELWKWGTSGQIAGVILGLIAWVSILWIDRSSFRRINELWDWHIIKSVEVLLSGLIFGLAVGAHIDLLVGIFSGLAIGLIAGISRNHTDRPIFGVADGVIVGLIGWLIYGVLTWLMGRQLLEGFNIELSNWLDIWLLAWLGIGAAAGLIAKLSATAKPIETLQGAGIDATRWSTLRWHRWLFGGAVAALVVSPVIGLLMGAGRPVKPLAIFFSSLGLSLIVMLCGPIIGALVGTAIGLTSVALAVALIGAITHGLTGPDIERRTTPNQGIRHAAVNAGRFALIGGLVLGSIWGLPNLVFAVLATGLTPDKWDCLSIWLASVLVWALIAALVPGAACIQHFTLRFILWCCGVIPWHYARFLDYATERMFLQRVGGRYRFIHDLLRDHFAAIEPKQSRMV